MMMVCDPDLADGSRQKRTRLLEPVEHEALAPNVAKLILSKKQLNGDKNDGICL